MNENVKFKPTSLGKVVNKDVTRECKTAKMRGRKIKNRFVTKAQAQKLSIPHGKIVKAIVDSLDQTNHDVILNWGQEKKAHIRGFSPDIIMASKGTSHAKFIFEVVSNKGITEVAAKQWKKCVDVINATPCIVVPEAHILEAERICNRVGVSTRFATYSVDSIGNVSLKFK